MSHYEASMERDITRLSGKLSEMAERNERNLRDGITALAGRNRQLAYSIILRDTFIDALDREIDRLCLEFIVRQQPVGAHLRFAVAAIKINLELERIGDYAKSIAKQVLKLSQLDVSFDIAGYQEIADRAIPLVREAIEALLHRDSDRAKRVVSAEAEVEKLRSQLNEQLLDERQAGRVPLAAFNPLLTISRRFTRVADQAKNIANETIYVVTGEYAKHQQSEILRVLFIDNLNAGASQMAEAIGQALGDSRFQFSSAGIAPGEVDPALVAFMKGKGIDLSNARSHALERIPNLDYYQVFIALTPEGIAAFPPDNARTVNLEWTIADPATPDAAPEAYDATYQTLNAHITDLVQALLGEREKASH